MSAQGVDPSLTIRGIPVSDLLVRCFELSKTFAAPIDLGLFITLIEALSTNPIWQLISIVLTRQPWQISSLEVLLFDTNFRAAVMELVLLWLNNKKFKWDFGPMESPEFFSTVNAVLPPIIVVPPPASNVAGSSSATSVKSNDSGYLTNGASASFSNTSVASASSSTPTPSMHVSESFMQVAAELQAQIDGISRLSNTNKTTSSAGSSSKVSRKRQTASSRKVIPTGIPHTSASAFNTSVGSPSSSASLLPSTLATSAKKPRHTNTTNTGNSNTTTLTSALPSNAAPMAVCSAHAQAPHPIDLPTAKAINAKPQCTASSSLRPPPKIVSPVESNSQVPKAPACDHAVAHELVKKKGSIDVIGEIADDIINAIDSNLFSEAALQKYFKEKMVTINKLAKEALSSSELE